MIRTKVRAPLALLVVLATVGAAVPAAAVTCSMRFNLSGWSFFYQTSSGRGRVTCDNGESADVRISVRGGGVTFGRRDIQGGVGNFSRVTGINEIFGAYATAEAHAGAVRSASAQVLTKGEVSLALSGTGRGWDVGVAFGSFRIERER